MKTNREQEIKESKELLDRNTKDEQRRYQEAKDNADKMSKELADVIIKVNTAKKELEPLYKEKIDLLNEISQTRKDNAEIREKSALILKRVADKEKDLEIQKVNFSNYKKQEEAKLEKKRIDLIDEQKKADIILSHAKDKELAAMNERASADKKIEDLNTKIREFKEYASKDTQNRAEIAQKQALNEQTLTEANSLLKEIDKLKIGLNSKENALIEREKNCDVKDKAQMDKDMEQNLRDARLTKRERDIEYLIETHKLKVK